MPSVHAQIAALTGMLAVATGLEPRKTSTANGVRIEADLPEKLSPTARSAILSALGTADSYGHIHTPNGEYVWAELPWEAS